MSCCQDMADWLWMTMYGILSGHCYGMSVRPAYGGAVHDTPAVNRVPLTWRPLRLLLLSLHPRGSCGMTIAFLAPHPTTPRTAFRMYVVYFLYVHIARITCINGKKFDQQWGKWRLLFTSVKYWPWFNVGNSHRGIGKKKCCILIHYPHFPHILSPR